MSVREFFFSSEREVIEALFQAEDWLDLYELHVEFRLSPAQIYECLERLSFNNFADIEGTRGRLTESGRRWVLASRRMIFLSPNLDWREIRDRGKSTHPGELYKPRFSENEKREFLDEQIGG